MTELRQRVITGALGAVALILLIVYGGSIGVALLAAALSLGMVHEYCEIVFSSEDKTAKRYGLLFLTWLVSVANFIAPRAEYELLIGCFLVLFTYFLFAARGRADERFTQHFRELKYAIFGMVYLVFLPLFLVRIRETADGVHWTLLFLLIVWAGDTLAYFTGKKYGKKKLYPEISPKKTVEGAYGGLAGGVLVALVYKLLFFRQMGWGAVLVAPVLVGAFEQIGDLCESFLKRAYGVKDSGSLLPGHGGILDRFDGVVFALPVMYACVRFFG